MDLSGIDNTTSRSSTMPPPLLTTTKRAWLLQGPILSAGTLIFLVVNRTHQVHPATCSILLLLWSLRPFAPFAPFLSIVDPLTRLFDQSTNLTMSKRLFVLNFLLLFSFYLCAQPWQLYFAHLRCSMASLNDRFSIALRSNA